MMFELQAELSGGQTAASYERDISSLNIDNPLDLSIIGSNTGQILTIQVTGSGSLTGFSDNYTKSYTISATVTTTAGDEVTNNALLIDGLTVYYILPTDINIS